VPAFAVRRQAVGIVAAAARHFGVGDLGAFLHIVVVSRESRCWCTVGGMGRITVDVNEEWLEAAREVLGTDTKVATINAALHAFAIRRQAVDIVAAFDSVPMDFDGSDGAWGYFGGRDLSRLKADARAAEAA